MSYCFKIDYNDLFFDQTKKEQLEEQQKKEFGKAYKQFIDSYLYPTEFSTLLDRFDVQEGIKEFLKWEESNKNTPKQFLAYSNPPRIIISVSGSGKVC